MTEALCLPVESMQLFAIPTQRQSNGASPIAEVCVLQPSVPSSLPEEEKVLSSGLEVGSKVPTSEVPSLKAESCHNPSLQSLCLPVHPTIKLMCVCMHRHLTDLKQVCKTRLPSRLKYSGAAGDLGGRGKATSVQTQTVPLAKWARKLLRVGSWVEAPMLGMFCLEGLGSEVSVHGGSHILRASHIWGSRLAGADGSPSAPGFNDS